MELLSAGSLWDQEGPSIPSQPPVDEKHREEPNFCCHQPLRFGGSAFLQHSTGCPAGKRTFQTTQTRKYTLETPTRKTVQKHLQENFLCSSCLNSWNTSFLTAVLLWGGDPLKEARSKWYLPMKKLIPFFFPHPSPVNSLKIKKQVIPATKAWTKCLLCMKPCVKQGGTPAATQQGFCHHYSHFSNNKWRLIELNL